MKGFLPSQAKLFLLSVLLIASAMVIAVALASQPSLTLAATAPLGYKFTFSSSLVPKTTTCNYDTQGGFYCPSGKTKNWTYCSYCGTGKATDGRRTAKRIDSFWSVDNRTRDCVASGNIDTTFYYYCTYKLRTTSANVYACGSCNTARVAQVVPAYLLVGECKESTEPVLSEKLRQSEAASVANLLYKGDLKGYL